MPLMLPIEEYTSKADEPSALGLQAHTHMLRKFVLKL